MAKLDMDGPFDYSARGIAQAVQEILPGTFAIGSIDAQRRFGVQYMGRDDADVQAGLTRALKSGVGKPGMLGRLVGDGRKATAFKFSYSRDAGAAFDKQCRCYHAFNNGGGLENPAHPQAPDGSATACPIRGERE